MLLHLLKTSYKTPMKNDKSPSALPNDMFLVSVQDERTGKHFETLSISRTPTVLLSFAANRFNEAASGYFKDRFNLGAVDWRMLFHLARYPESTAAQTAKTLVVDKGTVSRCLHRLEESGLVFAGELHANGRSRGWSLTDAGREAHDNILQAALENQESLLRNFNADEVRTLCDLLLRFLDNLENLVAEPNR